MLIDPSTVADGAFGKDRDLQGFMLSRLAADEAEVLTVAVAPRRRGRGIAGRLLQANIARLSRLGAKSLFLEVEAENQAGLALYRRFGIRHGGRAQILLPQGRRVGGAGLHHAPHPRVRNLTSSACSLRR